MTPASRYRKWPRCRRHPEGKIFRAPRHSSRILTACCGPGPRSPARLRQHFTLETSAGRESGRLRDDRAGSCSARKQRPRCVARTCPKCSSGVGALRVRHPRPPRAVGDPKVWARHRRHRHSHKALIEGPRPACSRESGKRGPQRSGCRSPVGRLSVEAGAWRPRS